MKRPDLRKNEIDTCAADPRNFPASAAIRDAVNSLHIIEEPEPVTVTLTVTATAGHTRSGVSTNCVDVDTRLVRQMVEALAENDAVSLVIASPGGTLYTRPVVQGGIDDAVVSAVEAMV